MEKKLSAQEQELLEKKLQDQQAAEQPAELSDKDLNKVAGGWLNPTRF